MVKLIDLCHVAGRQQSWSLNMSGGCRFEILFPGRIVGWVEPFSLTQEKLLDTNKPFSECRLGPWST